jgi:hypothetical protein
MAHTVSRPLRGFRPAITGAVIEAAFALSSVAPEALAIFLALML